MVLLCKNVAFALLPAQNLPCARHLESFGDGLPGFCCTFRFGHGAAKLATTNQNARGFCFFLFPIILPLREYFSHLCVLYFMRHLKNLLFVGVLGVGALLISSVLKVDANNGDYPVEAGPAKFLRNHGEAMKLSKKSGKPVFAFFQEVPG